jgi:hypothetical protein
VFLILLPGIVFVRLVVVLGMRGSGSQVCRVIARVGKSGLVSVGDAWVLLPATLVGRRCRCCSVAFKKIFVKTFGTG